MDPFKERNFHKSKDSSLKLTLILKRIKILDYLLVSIINISITLIKLFLGQQAISSKHLVIICLHRLGDTVFCIPAIKGIHDCYKDYKIFILCYPESKTILELEFENEDIVTIEKNDYFFQRRIAKKKCREIVNNLKPEIIFDLTGDPSSTSLIITSGAKEIIGTNLKYFQKLYTSFIILRKKPHCMDIYLDVLRSVKPDYKNYSYQFESNYSPKDKVMIHPFAIRKAKEWNLHKFIQLGKRLNEKYDVCLIAPPNFIDDDIIDEIKSINLKVEITNTVNELIEKLKEASLFISNDSGPIYIANLLGKPTFTIYGPTNPSFSLPFGINNKSYKKELSCSPKGQMCFKLGGINCSSYECMNLITVDEIEGSVNSFIKHLSIEEKNSNKLIVN